MSAPRTAAITGHFRLLHPTEFLCAADLRDRDVNVVIDRAEWEVLQMPGGRKERKPVLHLRSVAGKPLGKRLVVNKTNLKLIANSLGDPMVDHWGGKKITIYPTRCRGADGSQVECIRVRVRQNAAASDVTEEMAAAPEPRAEFLDEAGDASEEGTEQ